MSEASTLIAELVQCGVALSRNGERLVLDGPEALLTDLLVERARALKADILRRLGDWDAVDWRAFFDERAGIAEFDGGLSRTDAELIAFEDCLDHWLAINPPPAVLHALCIHCGRSVDSHDAENVSVTGGLGKTGVLHANCAPRWFAARKWEARGVLIRLLQNATEANK